MADSLPARVLPWVLVPAAGLSLYLGYLRCGGPERARAGETAASTVPRSRFTDRVMPAVADLVAAAYGGLPIEPEGLSRFAEPNHGVYVALRAGGRLRGSEWREALRSEQPKATARKSGKRGQKRHDIVTPRHLTLPTAGGP